MGTNFYLRGQKPCEHCGRSYEDLHIGRSAVGWVFFLRIHPSEGIHDLNDWVKRFKMEGAVIYDEYGNEVDKFSMLERIVCRFHPDGLMTGGESYHNDVRCIRYTVEEREFS